MRSNLVYRPYALFARVSGLLAILGFIAFVRCLVLVTTNAAGDHIQPLLLGILLIIEALLALVIGVVADLTRINRTLADGDARPSGTSAVRRLMPTGTRARSIAIAAMTAAFTAALVL